MSEFDWKKEIDKAISTKPLLTEEFVQRVQQPKKKRKPVFIPALVILLLVITAFLFIPKHQPEQATETVTPVSTEDLLTTYFQAIEQADDVRLQEVSATETTASPKEIIQKYDSLNPLAYKVLKKTEDDKVDVFMLQIPAKQGVESFVKHYVVNKEQQTVSEDLYGDEQIYKVFEHPQQISLQFEVAPVEEQLDLPVEEPSDERILHSGDRVLRYDRERAQAFYIESTRGVFYLGEISKNDTWFVDLIPNIEETILMIGNEDSMMYAYFNEEMQMYQRLVGNRSEKYGTASYKIDAFENPIFTMHAGGQTIVGTVENGQLIGASINFGIELELYQQQLIEIEPVGSAFLIKYVEEYEQRSSYYSFKTNRLLIKN